MVRAERGRDMENNTQVEVRVTNSVGIIEISGEVTGFSEEDLQNAYEELCGQGLAKLGLSFEKVSYINSAGMAIIIGILTNSRERKQMLRCWGLTEHFRKIFDMVGITKYMPNHESEKEALASFSREADTH